MTEKERGKWTSNVRKEDVPKIKRTFPRLVEGPPQVLRQQSDVKLSQDGIVGLYLEVED